MSREERTANTRAEQVRQRRQQESNNRQEARQGGRSKSQSSSRYYEVNMPPVVVRGNVGTPVLQRTATRQRQRRQIAIPLPHSGAEVVMPGMPVLQFGARWLSGALAILFGFLLMYMISAGTFEVSQPEIKGLQRLTPAEIENVLQLRGETIFSIEPAEIQLKLERSFPELKSIQVEVGLPATVTINVQERQPAILWHTADQVYWSDQEGVLFPPHGDEEVLLTIKVEGSLPVQAIEAILAEETDEMNIQNIAARPQKIDSAALFAAQKMASHVPEGTTLTYNHENGLGWIDPNGCKVYVGMNASNLDEKLAVYQTILQKAQQKGLQPAVISVAQVNAPFYRLEP